MSWHPEPSNWQAARTKSHLTPRELEVAKLVAVGHPHKEIADILGVKIKTVSFHVNGFYRKTGVTSIAGTVHHMISAGHIKLGQTS